MVKKEQMKVGVVVKMVKGDLAGMKVQVTHLDYSDNTFKGIPINSTEESPWQRFSYAEMVDQTREYLMEERKALILSLEKIDEKIAWMNEVGSDEFDETQFKVWNVLKTMDDKGLSMNERVKIIAELVK